MASPRSRCAPEHLHPGWAELQHELLATSTKAAVQEGAGGAGSLGSGQPLLLPRHSLSAPLSAGGDDAGPPASRRQSQPGCPSEGASQPAASPSRDRDAVGPSAPPEQLQAECPSEGASQPAAAHWIAAASAGPSKDGDAPGPSGAQLPLLPGGEAEVTFVPETCYDDDGAGAAAHMPEGDSSPQPLTATDMVPDSEPQLPSPRSQLAHSRAASQQQQQQAHLPSGSAPLLPSPHPQLPSPAALQSPRATTSTAERRVEPPVQVRVPVPQPVEPSAPEAVPHSRLAVALQEAARGPLAIARQAIRAANGLSIAVPHAADSLSTPIHATGGLPATTHAAACLSAVHAADGPAATIQLPVTTEPSVRQRAAHAVQRRSEAGAGQKLEALLFDLKLTRGEVQELADAAMGSPHDDAAERCGQRPWGFGLGFGV